MGITGKILAIFNVLAGIAFISMAALDYGKHQAWTFAVLQEDYVLQGLPVDEKDPGPDGQPLSPYMQKQLGATVKSQHDEISPRHNALKQAVDSAQDDEKRKKLEAILVPLARTLGDREELRRQIQSPTNPVNDLLTKPDGPFETAFKDALAPGQPGNSVEQGSARRQAIAHVLIGTSQNQADLQRAMTAVGAINYVRELDAQALALNAMVPELQRSIVNDREAFAVEHRALIGQIIALADRVRDAQQNIDRQNELVERHKGIVDKRRADVADLNKRIEDAKKATAVALAEQTDLEKQLFAADTKVAAEESKNQRLEREIKTRELGSEGGK